MILEEDSIPLLQAYLIRTLEPICAAEPSVLASYVIALLQNEKPKDELKTFCEEELQDFLKEVLKEDKSGKYTLIEDKESGATLSSTVRKRSNEEKDSLYSKLLKSSSNIVKVPSSHSVSDSDSKKRKVEDSDSNSQNATTINNNMNNTNTSTSTSSTSNNNISKKLDMDVSSKKIESKEDSKAAEEFTKSLKHVEEYVPSSPSILHSSSTSNSSLSSNYDNRDSRFDNRDSRFDNRDSRGKRKYERERDRGDRSSDRADRDKFSYHSHRDRDRNGRDRKERPREKCRDYEERGYCVRGELCNYDHGSDKIIIPGITGNANTNSGNNSNLTSDSNIYSSIPSTGQMDVETVPMTTYPISYLNSSNHGNANQLNYGNNTNNENNNSNQHLNTSNDSISIPLFVNNSNSDASTLMGTIGNNNLNLLPSVNIPGINSFLPSLVNPMHAMIDSIISRVEDDEDANIIQVGGKGMYNPNYKYFANNNNNLQPQNSSSFNFQNSNSSTSSSIPSSEYNPRFNREREKEKSKENSSSDTKLENTIIDNTTLMISNIPEDLLVSDKLSSHFLKFGEIQNILIKPYLKKAFVKFKESSDAQKAIDSPDAVLGNRFIRISWAKRQNNRPKQLPITSSSTSSSSNPMNNNSSSSSTVPSQDPLRKAKKPRVMQITNGGNSTIVEGTMMNSANNNTATPPLEKVKKLKKQKEEIRKMQIEQTKEMLDKLTKAKNVDPSQKMAIIKRLLSVTDSLSSSIAKDKESATSSIAVPLPPPPPPASSSLVPIPTVSHDSKKELKKELLDKELDAIAAAARDSSSTPSDPPTTQNTTDESTSSGISTTTSKSSKSATLEMLKKKYASLQKMAASMGISQGASSSHLLPQKRKSSFTSKFPKQANNNNNNNNININNNSASKVIDNRTTSLLVRIPVSSSSVEISDESVQEHFTAFGEISKFKKLPISNANSFVYLLQFSTRRSAEQAMNKGKIFNGQTMQMTWFENKSTSKAPEEKSLPKDSSPSDSMNSSMEIEKNSIDGISDDESDETEKSWKH